MIVQKSIHMFLHLIALCLGIVGICAVFRFHDMIQAEDVYSLHSWVGMSTFCLFCLQVRKLYPTRPRPVAGDEPGFLYSYLSLN
jgi:cytochrome b561